MIAAGEVCDREIHPGHRDPTRPLARLTRPLPRAQASSMGRALPVLEDRSEADDEPSATFLPKALAAAARAQLSVRTGALFLAARVSLAFAIARRTRLYVLV